MQVQQTMMVAMPAVPAVPAMPAIPMPYMPFGMGMLPVVMSSTLFLISALIPKPFRYESRRCQQDYHG